MKQDSFTLEVKDGTNFKIRYKDFFRKLQSLVKKFKKSANITRYVLDEHVDGIFIKDLTGRYQIVNSEAAEIFGASLEKIIGKTIDDILPKDEAKEIKAEDEKVLKTHEQKVLIRSLIRNNKRKYYLCVKGVFKKDSKNASIITLCKDITDIFEIELSLKNTEQQFKELFDSVPIGLYHTTPDGKILMANKSFIKMLGFSSLEQLTKNNLEQRDFGPTYSRSKFYERINKEEEVKGLESVWITKNKTPIFVRENVKAIKGKTGKIIYFEGSAEDITERKQMEESLSTQANILESSQDGIITSDMEGLITHWSRGAELLYGYKAAEVLGKSIEIIIPKDKSKEVKGIFRSLKVGGYIKDYETIRVKKNGEYINVFISVCPVKDAAGNTTGVASIARNITERKLYEKQREMLIAVAGHELKTPITSIKAFTQLLQKRLQPGIDNESKEYLNRVTDQVDKMIRLTRDLLDAVKLRGGILTYRKKYFNLDELIYEVVEEIKRTTKKHEIYIEGLVDVQIYADRGRISQVLSNLLHNAIKYSPNSGRIILRVIQEMGSVNISVRDFGIGIPEESRNQIFQSFYRGDYKKKEILPGLGLGLYIASQIIKFHGGRIWMESEGRGSTFTFTLPIAGKPLHTGKTLGKSRDTISEASFPRQISKIAAP